MAGHNPYAPSAATLKGPEPSAAENSTTGIWRDGRVVVMDHNASLPARCVKCNAPAHQPTKVRKVYWHHPGLYLLILAWMLLYIIVALIVRKRADVEPGLCENHKLHRGIAIAVGLLGPVLGLVLAFKSVETPVLLPVGLLLILFSAIYGVARGRVVYARKIDDYNVRLGGFCRDYLDSLPEWPG